MAKLNTKIVMLEGEQGTNIKSVEKSASDGLTDTYTITLTDGSKSSFNVTNGKGISSIEKASASGLVDTYTITYNDGTTQNYTVNNGRGISSISKTGASGLDDIYTITYNDGTTSTFTVTNGKDGAYSVQTQIVPAASIERGETASKAYSVGDFLVKDGILYKVTKNIAKDDAMTVGGNIESDTLCGEISSLSEKTTLKDISSDVSIVTESYSHASVTSISALRIGVNVKLYIEATIEIDVMKGAPALIGTIKGLNIRMNSINATTSNLQNFIIGKIYQNGDIVLTNVSESAFKNDKFWISFDLIVE